MVGTLSPLSIRPNDLGRGCQISEKRCQAELKSKHAGRFKMSLSKLYQNPVSAIWRVQIEGSLCLTSIIRTPVKALILEAALGSGSLALLWNAAARHETHKCSKIESY